MISQTVTLDKVRKSKRWNAEFFINSHKSVIKADGYTLMRLRELLTERREFLNPIDFKERLFNYIGLENISQNTRNLVTFKPQNGSKIKSRCKIFRNGDILYGRLRPTLNKCYIVDDILSEGICSTEIFVLKPNLKIVTAEYIAEILTSPMILDRVGSITGGAALPRMQLQDFLDLEVPIPPINTQIKISEDVKKLRYLAKEYAYKADMIFTRIPINFLKSIECQSPFSVVVDEFPPQATYNNPLPNGNFLVRGKKKAQNL